MGVGAVMRLAAVIATLLLGSCAPCVRSERRMVHHDGWWQYLPFGDNNFTMIWWPPSDDMETVCLERAKR